MSITVKPRTQVRGGAHTERPASRWWPLGVIAAAHLMAVVDITVMFVALPSAQRALHMSVGARRWGAGLLLVLAIPVALLINAAPPRRAAQANASGTGR